jgi:hypothetical protein
MRLEAAYGRTLHPSPTAAAGRSASASVRASAPGGGSVGGSSSRGPSGRYSVVRAGILASSLQRTARNEDDDDRDDREAAEDAFARPSGLGATPPRTQTPASAAATGGGAGGGPLPLAPEGHPDRVRSEEALLARMQAGSYSARMGGSGAAAGGAAGSAAQLMDAALAMHPARRESRDADAAAVALLERRLEAELGQDRREREALAKALAQRAEIAGRLRPQGSSGALGSPTAAGGSGSSSGGGMFAGYSPRPLTSPSAASPQLHGIPAVGFAARMGMHGFEGTTPSASAGPVPPPPPFPPPEGVRRLSVAEMRRNSAAGINAASAASAEADAAADTAADATAAAAASLPAPPAPPSADVLYERAAPLVRDAVANAMRAIQEGQQRQSPLPAAAAAAADGGDESKALAELGMAIAAAHPAAEGAAEAVLRGFEASHPATAGVPASAAAPPPHMGPFISATAYEREIERLMQSHAVELSRTHAAYEKELLSLALKPSQPQVEAYKALTAAYLRVEAERGDLAVGEAQARRELETLRDEMRHFRQTRDAELAAAEASVVEAERRIMEAETRLADVSSDLRSTVAAYESRLASLTAAYEERLATQGKEARRTLELAESEAAARQEALKADHLRLVDTLRADSRSQLDAQRASYESMGARASAEHAEALRRAEQGHADAVERMARDKTAAIATLTEAHKAELAGGLAARESSLREAVAAAAVEGTFSDAVARASVPRPAPAEGETTKPETPFQRLLAEISSDMRKLRETEASIRATAVATEDRLTKTELALAACMRERDALAGERSGMLDEMSSTQRQLRVLFQEAREAKERLMVDMQALEEERGTMIAERRAHVARERQLVSLLIQLGVKVPAPPVPILIADAPPFVGLAAFSGNGTMHSADASGVNRTAAAGSSPNNNSSGGGGDRVPFMPDTPTGTQLSSGAHLAGVGSISKTLSALKDIDAAGARVAAILQQRRLVAEQALKTQPHPAYASDSKGDVAAPSAGAVSIMAARLGLALDGSEQQQPSAPATVTNLTGKGAMGATGSSQSVAAQFPVDVLAYHQLQALKAESQARQNNTGRA